MKRYNRILSNTLKEKKRFLYICIFISMIAFTLFSAYSMFYETKEQNRIEFVRQEYGDYHAAFYNIDNEQSEIIDENENIDSVVETPLSIFMLNEDNLILSQYMFEDELKYTDIQICDGRFPTGKNEVAVEKWFMLQQGYTSEEMLGAELIFMDEGGHSNIYKVTGLICGKTSYGDSATSHFSCPLMLMSRETMNANDFVYRNLYVKYKDTERMLKEIELDVYNISNDGESVSEVEYSINTTLTYALGTDPIAKAEIRDRHRVNKMIWVALMIFLLFSMNNVINICISKWNGIIKLHKQIGTDMGSLIIHMIFLLVKYALIGEILGIILGYGFIWMIKDIWMYSVVNTMVQIPWKMLLGCMAGCILIIVVLLCIKLCPLCYRTSYEIQNSYVGTFHNRTRVKMYEDLFGRWVPNSLRMALRNMWFYKIRKIMMILCIAISIGLLYLIYFQMETEHKAEPDNNYEYTYKINIESKYFLHDNEKYESVCKLYQQLMQLCNNYDCTPYFGDFFTEEIQLDKKFISDSYKQQMNQSVVEHMNLIDSRSFLTKRVAIMGYSEWAIQELCINNNLPVKQLKENQCLMLERTVNREGTYSGVLNSTVGSKYTFAPYGEGTEYEVEVVGMIEDIPVYPETMENCFCIIISDEAYLKFHKMDYIEKIYLKDVSNEMIKELEQLVKGTDYLVLTNQEDEIAVAKRNRQMNNIICLLFFIMCNVAVFINMILIIYYESTLRDHDFAMYGALGISRGVSFRICIYELILSYVLGVVLGIAGILLWRKGVSGYNVVVVHNSMVDGIWIGMAGLCILISGAISYIRIRKVSLFTYHID